MREGVRRSCAGVAVEWNAGSAKLTDGRFDVDNTPAEDGEGLGLELVSEGSPDMSAVGFKYEGERRLVFQEGKAELIAVEKERALSLSTMATLAASPIPLPIDRHQSAPCAKLAVSAGLSWPTRPNWPPGGRLGRDEVSEVAEWINPTLGI